MKNILNQWLSRCVLGFGILLMATACSDEHFDVKSWAGGDKSLWENVESNAELSDFANILKRTKVMKNENDKSASFLASDLLRQPQSFTIWAPVNGTYDSKLWIQKLDEAQALRKEGTAQARTAAQRKEWEVWSQFVANHIARFNYEGAPTSAQVQLLNGKNVSLVGKQLNGIAQAGEQVNANNGSLHLLKGRLPFAYNIYDYIFAKESTSELATYLNSPLVAKEDTAWKRMTPGTVNEYGKMVYLDTLFNRYNLVIDDSRAFVRDEDSTYVAFIPSNKAWNEAINKVEKIYKYAPKYNYSWISGANFQQTGNTAYKLSDKIPGQTYTFGDSLQRYNVRAGIIKSMFFAPYAMGNNLVADSAALINHVLHADSLKSTNGLIYYNPAAKKDQKNAVLNPVLQGITPYRASNGYVFELADYGFDPAYSFLERSQSVLSKNPQYYVARTDNVSSQYGMTITLSEFNYNKYRPKLDENGQAVLDEQGNPVYEGVKGEIEGNKYLRFENNNPKRTATIDLRLPRVFSAAYTIKLVVAPAQINTDFVPPSTTDHQLLRFRAEIVYDDDTKSSRVEISEKKGEFDPTKINTLQLWDKYEFTRCYAGLPMDKESFPRLRLTLLPEGPNNNCKELNVVALIVEPYRGQ